MKKSLLLICFALLLQPMAEAQSSISVKTSGSGDPILYSFSSAADSKHYLMLDQPEWFHSELGKFLAN